MNITLKDFPEELHHELTMLAEEEARSLNKQIIHMLKTLLRPKANNRKNLVNQIRLRRNELKTWKVNDINKAITTGRS